MTRIIVKGINYTEIISRRKDSIMETVQYFRLAKPRKPEDCGVWKDGKRVESLNEVE